MIATERRLTAVQVILMAADDLATSGADEFSEFDLTVASWNRDRQRFGLRGYANLHPDHKRAMMEIMGNKASNPILLRFMEKTRPNFYRLTPLGRVEAARLRGVASGKPEAANSMRDLYDSVAVFANHATFARWKDEPSEPEKWKEAAAFLGLRSDRPGDSTERMQNAWTLTRSAIDWCLAQKMDALPQGTHRTSPSIHMRDLSDLLSFLQALKYRFPEHLEAESGLKRRPSRN